jgi:glycyl-tRNA synthetase beta chain
MVRKEPWFASICTASKRVENILKKAPGAFDIDPSLFVQDEEKALHGAYVSVKAEFLSKAGRGSYTEALKMLAGLKDPIDTFFDKVLVLCVTSG